MKDDESILCRCEEITKKEIEDAIELGYISLDMIKKKTRAGWVCVRVEFAVNL